MHDANLQHPAAISQLLSWDDLRVFAALAHRRSARQAAKDLGLDASTAGRRLKTLERALGAQLFERLPEGLRLTPAGHEVVSVATAMQSRVRELEHAIGGLDTRVAGQVCLTVAELLAPLVCACLGPLLLRNPNLELELIATDALVKVERHAAQVAVRVADEPPPQLVGQRVAQSAVGLYASVDYLGRWGTNLKQAHHRWIAWPKYVEHKPAFAWLAQTYPKRQSAVRGNSAGTVLQAVRAGLGIAPLSCVQAASEPSLRLVRRLPAACSTSVWVLAHPQMKDTARVRAVVDALTSELRARRSELVGVAD